MCPQQFNAVQRILALLAISALLWGSSVAASDSSLRVQLLWHHQAQFAGFYVADALGYFEREGISVELLPGGPGIDPMQNAGHRHR